MATTKTAFGGGLNSSSGGELKLYLCCTGSMGAIISEAWAIISVNGISSDL